MVDRQLEQNSPFGIDPDAAYRPTELAGRLKTTRRPVDRAIQRGELRAVTINDRGDTRIAGTWALEWLARRQVTS